MQAFYLWINRYIMECKYLVYNYKHKEGCSELIDTLWNVNDKPICLL